MKTADAIFIPIKTIKGRIKSCNINPGEGLDDYFVHVVIPTGPVFMLFIIY